MQHVPPKCSTIRPEQGRLRFAIYWSTLIHVGFSKVPLAVEYLSKIHRKQDGGGDLCDIDGRK